MSAGHKSTPSLGREIAVALFTVVVSVILAWFVAGYSANQKLDRRAMEGEAILNSIGYSYFVALFETTDAKHYTDGRVKFNNPPSKVAYFEMLHQIQQDIRWLVGNHGYFRNAKKTQPKMGELTAIRSFLEIERALQSSSPLFGSLEFMCRTFAGKYFNHWVSSSQYSLGDSLYSFRSTGVSGEVDAFVGYVRTVCKCVEQVRKKTLYKYTDTELCVGDKGNDGAMLRSGVRGDLKEAAHSC